MRLARSIIPPPSWRGTTLPSQVCGRRGPRPLAYLLLTLAQLLPLRLADTAANCGSAHRLRWFLVRGIAFRKTKIAILHAEPSLMICRVFNKFHNVVVFWLPVRRTGWMPILLPIVIPGPAFPLPILGFALLMRRLLVCAISTFGALSSACSRCRL